MNKHFLSKPFFVSFLVIIFVAISCLGVLDLFIPTIDGIAKSTIFDYAINITKFYHINIYCFAIFLIACLTLPILILSFIGIIKRKLVFLYSHIIYAWAQIILIFLFEILYSRSMGVINIILIINFILSIIALVYLMVYKRQHINQEVNKKEESVLPTKSVANAVTTLISLGLIICLSIFFLPLYTINGENAALFTCLSERDLTLVFICFLTFFIAFTVCLLFYISTITISVDKLAFIKRSKSLMILYMLYTIAFFVTGFTICFIASIQKLTATTFSFIPMLLMFVVAILNAYFVGKVSVKEEKEIKKRKKNNVLSLILVIAIAVVTVMSLELNIIKVDLVLDNSSISVDIPYKYNVALTGFQLLADYANLDAGFQVMAYLLVIMLGITAIGVILTLTSFISKSTYYKQCVRYTIALNLFFVIAISASGLYFSIANKINETALIGMLEYYLNVKLSNLEYTYSVKTDLVYALILDIVFIMIVLGKRILDKTEYNLIAIEGVSNNQGVPSAVSNLDVVGEEDYDLCPTFSQIDTLIPHFKEDLKERMKNQAKEADLNSFINYIVTYARNSHLHLSYSKEDVAAFVAGLGITRLSILQGMSGTGKTSLPKIFMEAINGNCEIIEVESSWKDKNELLGYYNEFSEKYTPKKFTQALYKAALNKEVPTFIVLDEMNLSRVEYYFSDFLSLMENEEDKRVIQLVNVKLSHQKDGVIYDYKALRNGTTLNVPSNVWFIGTANRDESTFVISDKVYDRAHTMNFNKRAAKVRNFGEELKPVFYSYEMLKKMLDEALTTGNFDAEDNPLISKVEAILAPYNISFGNRILKQIEGFVNIYVACFNDESLIDEAVETILLSKVVSKLETKVIEDKDGLISEFEELGLSRCVKFIETLNED